MAFKYSLSLDSLTESPSEHLSSRQKRWLFPDYCIVMRSKNLYAGSQWYSDPGLSEKKIVVSQELFFQRYAYDNGSLLWDAKVRFDVGITCLDAVIDSDTSFGIIINVTYLGGVEKPIDSLRFTLGTITVRVPSQALKVLLSEFQDQHGGKGIVNSNFKIAGSMLVAAAATFALTYSLPVGAVVGLSAGGAMINSIFDFVKDTQEAPFESYYTTGSYAGASLAPMGPVSSGQSAVETGFVRVEPVAPTHCGLVEVTVEGNLQGASVFTYIDFPVYVA